MEWGRRGRGLGGGARGNGSLCRNVPSLPEISVRYVERWHHFISVISSSDISHAETPYAMPCVQREYRVTNRELQMKNCNKLLCK